MKGDIRWSNLTYFRGRNGLFKCSGVYVQIQERLGLASLVPITSKDKLGSCMLEIPNEARMQVALAICPELETLLNTTFPKIALQADLPALEPTFDYKQPTPKPVASDASVPFKVHVVEKPKDFQPVLILNDEIVKVFR